MKSPLRPSTRSRLGWGGARIAEMVVNHRPRVAGKAKYGLGNKSEAVRLIIQAYESEFLEPELKPEFIEKMEKRRKEPTVKVKDFRKHFGLDEDAGS